MEEVIYAGLVSRDFLLDSVPYTNFSSGGKAAMSGKYKKAVHVWIAFFPKKGVAIR
jgi:hypothetical protein